MRVHLDIFSIVVFGASVLLLTGCQQQQSPDAPREATTRSSTSDQRNKTMTKVEEIAWGFMQARVGAGGDRGRVFAIRTPAEYAAFAADMSDDGYLELSVPFPTPPSFDPEREVLIFVEFPDGAGSELRPVVDGVDLEGDHAQVHAHWTTNPEGAATDDISRNWVLVRAPKSALEGSPTLSFELEPGVR